MRFLYLRDPLFLFCLVTYFLNRFVLKAIWKEGFVHEHLNDLLCIPFWVPIMLFAQRRLGLRDSDAAPRPSELVIPLIIWSWMFEIVLPAMDGRFVADHLDILYYSVGTLAAGIFWNWWYREVPEYVKIGAAPFTGEP
jgi:hypothetical protein